MTDLQQVLHEREETVQELQERLQTIRTSDMSHVGLQTNLSSPKNSPKSPKLTGYSPKTSPLTSPKVAARRTSSELAEVQRVLASSELAEVQTTPEDTLDNDNSEGDLHVSRPPVTVYTDLSHGSSSLHAELEAVGVDVADPYDSEGVSGSIGTGSNVSLDDHMLAAKSSTSHSVHSYQTTYHSLSMTHSAPVREEEEEEVLITEISFLCVCVYSCVY